MGRLWQGGMWNPNPPSNLDIKTKISRLGSIPDHQQGTRRKLSPAKLGTHLQGGESKRSADKSRLGGEMMP
jgi:hypothetical protein